MNASLEFLLDNHLFTYPLDVDSIIREKNIILSTYSDFSKRSAIPFQQLVDFFSEFGFCKFLNNRFYIFYNDTIASSGNTLWTKTHELTHIVRGHITPERPTLSRGHQKTKLEMMTDMFTRRILSPMCLLYLYHVQSIEHVMLLTGLSYTAAKITFDIYSEKKKANKFGTLPLERQLMKKLKEHQTKVFHSNSF